MFKIVRGEFKGFRMTRKDGEIWDTLTLENKRLVVDQTLTFLEAKKINNTTQGN